MGLLGGFQGWPIQSGTMPNVVGAEPCCHGNEIWARCRDLVAYRLVSSLCCCIGLVTPGVGKRFGVEDRLSPNDLAAGWTAKCYETMK